MSIEKINYESVIDQLKNPEDLKNPEKNENYTSINLKRTADFCKENFNNPENKKEICNFLNQNFSNIFTENGIDFKNIYETKTGNKLDLA